MVQRKMSRKKKQWSGGLGREDKHHFAPLSTFLTPGRGYIIKRVNEVWGILQQVPLPHAPPLLFFSLHWYHFQWSLPVSLCVSNGGIIHLRGGNVSIYSRCIVLKKTITLSFSILEKSLTAIFNDSETSSWTRCRSCKRQRKKLYLNNILK